PDQAVPRPQGVIVRDELSGREVVYAPGRAHRPGAGRGAIDAPSEQELADCPFCAGREDRTPPETYRVSPSGPEPQGDWTVRETPPAVRAERGLSLEGDVVEERDGLLLLCPRVSRLPYELLIAPADAERSAFESPRLAAALALLADALSRLHEIEGAVPLNAW